MTVRFKKTLVRDMLIQIGHVERMGDETVTKIQKQMAGKWRGKEHEEDRNCDGRTALRESWKEW